MLRKSGWSTTLRTRRWTLFVCATLLAVTTALLTLCLPSPPPFPFPSSTKASYIHTPSPSSPSSSSSSPSSLSEQLVLHRVQVLPPHLEAQETPLVCPASVGDDDDGTEEAGKKEAVHVVYASDQGYFKGLLASINSVQRNTRRCVMFHIVVQRGEAALLLPQLVSFLDTNTHGVELLEFNTSAVADSIRVWRGDAEHANPFNYARFFLPALFPRLGKLVYLDPDTLLTASIAYLHHALPPFNASASPPVPFLAAVPQGSTYSWLLRRCEDAEVRAVVKNCRETYFNAGVFVTDLAGWRAHNTSQQLLGWLRANTQRPLWRFGSQPPLAIVFYHNWIKLPWFWNVRNLGWMEGLPSFRLSQAKLLHYSGWAKPWEENAISKFRGYWCKYYPFQAELLSDYKYASCWANHTVHVPASPFDYSLLLRWILR